jgi:hypothetical protein
MRAVVATLFLAGVAALAYLVAFGRIDLLAIAPVPPGDETDQRNALLGTRSLEGFEMQRLSFATGAVVWSATGRTLERSGEGPSTSLRTSFLATEPRVAIHDRDGDTTRIAAPRARFGALAVNGKLAGELTGGVSVVASSLALATERLSIDLPAGEGTARRPDFETKTPVMGTFARSEPGKLPVHTGVIAEGGITAHGLRRLELRGPVTIRDEAGDLLLDASRDATVVLAPAPWTIVNRLEGSAGALAGMKVFGRRLERGLVVAALEARGDVRFETRTRDGARIVARGEHLATRTLEGTVLVEGPDASLAELSSGVSVKAPWIFARDTGASGTHVLARGGAELGARWLPAPGAAPRELVLAGEDVDALLVPVEKTLRVESARVRSSVAHPGHYWTRDGDFFGTFDELEQRGDELGQGALAIRGSPVDAFTGESHVRARRLFFVRALGEPDRILAEEDAFVAMGSDVRKLLGERGVAAVSTAGAAWVVSGDRVALEVAAGRILGAHAEGNPAAVDAGDREGSPLHVDARTLDLDGTTGVLDALGTVHASAGGPHGEFGLSCGHAVFTGVADPVERKKLDPARRPFGVPADVVSFTADEDVKLDGPDGLLLEADTVAMKERTLTASVGASSGSGRVHARGRGAEALARSLVARDLGTDARTLDLVDDASIAWSESGTTAAIAADRIHALAFAGDLPKGPEISWGPITAWQESERPLVLRSRGPGGDFVGKGRVLRAYPRSGRATLTGSVESDLTGKAGIPLHFEAPRVSVQLEPGARFAKPSGDRRAGKRTDTFDQALTLLGPLKGCESSGGVRARYGDRTVEADSLEYDGKEAFFRGSPVRVRERTADTSVYGHPDIFRLDLSEPGER